MDKDAYALRIAQANPAQLVVINFELILAFLDEHNIERAKNALEQLIRALNFEVPLAHDFYEVYKYVNSLLVIAQVSQDEAKAKQAVAESRELLETLLTGWKDAQRQVDELNLPPVAGESPAVYSGLTYSKDGQADEYIDDSDKKGFMA